MTKKLYIGIGILLAFSLSIFVFGTLYQNSLPKIVEEINNSALGAILTAFITVLLLSQQSKSEEVRDRNVKVFEEKSKKYNDFINELWKIWEDRQVSLEEMNNMLKIISRDIIMYTKPDTVQKILEHMEYIAEQIKANNGVSEKSREATLIIQSNIFSIINELAGEIGLGGTITNGVRTKLRTLEDQVVPYLNQKEFITIYIKDFKETIEILSEKENIDITDVVYADNYFICQIKKSPVFIKIGPFQREKNKLPTIGFYSEYYGNKVFTEKKYREAERGPLKDYLKKLKWDAKIPNFSDFEEVEALYSKYNGNRADEPNNELAKIVVGWYKEWRFPGNGKNIDEIIDECIGNE